MIGKENDSVSTEEMKQNIELIKEQIPIFKKEFTKIAKNKVELNSSDIEKIINNALKSGELSIFQERIMTGFYDTWMAVFMMVGSDKEALQIVFNMIGV